jgi:hypothetical protein
LRPFNAAINKKAHLQTEDGPFIEPGISSATWQSFDEGSMVLRPRITTGLLLSENYLISSGKKDNLIKCRT